MNAQSKQTVDLVIKETASVTELTDQVNAACQSAEKKDCKGILITSNTSQQGQITDWPGDEISIREINRWERALRRLERVPVMIVMEIGGLVSGPSIDLLLVSDYRLAFENTIFHLPQNKGQVWPGMFLHRLVSQLGVLYSRQLLLMLKPLGVERAHQIGFIDEVVSASGRAQQKLNELANVSNQEIATVRQLIKEAMHIPAEEALGAHLAACDRQIRTKINQEALMENV